MYEDYLKVAAEQFDVVTAENACKMSVLQPRRGQYNWQRCDAIYNFTKNVVKGQFRGHALCWGKLNGLPGWMKSQSMAASEVRSELQKHIRRTMQHYGTEAMLGWDVVNEAITDDRNAEDFLHSPSNNPLSKLGSDYIDMCFREAHLVEPKVKLFYNDYNVGSISEQSWTAKKANRLYDMIEGMLKRNVPIHGVGLQLHVSYDMKKGEKSYANKAFLAGVRENVERLGALGIEVHFTEIDVAVYEDGEADPNLGGMGGGDGTRSTWTPAMEEKQAEIYQSLMETCLAVPQCKVFQMWGFTDKHTWRGTHAHPLIFSESLVPKKAYTRMMDVLEGRVPTPASTPAPQPAPHCQVWCAKRVASGVNSWSQVCAWKNCNDCTECSNAR